MVESCRIRNHTIVTYEEPPTHVVSRIFLKAKEGRAMEEVRAEEQLALVS